MLDSTMPPPYLKSLAAIPYNAWNPLVGDLRGVAEIVMTSWSTV